MSLDRYADIANRYLEIGAKSNTGEWMAKCPFCASGGYPLQFNVTKGLFVCFRCSEKGSAKRLVRHMGGTYSDPGASAEFLQASLNSLLHRKEKEQDVLPESVLRRYTGRPHEYWAKRKFSLATIQEWGLGYDPLQDRCTIPYRNSEGDLLGVIQRRLDDGFPRYLYPAGFDRRGSLFASWRVSGIEKVAIVEGSLDAIRCWQAGVPAVAQYGSSLSREQVRLLKELGVKTLVQMYDADKAGFRARYQCANAVRDIRVLTVPWTKQEYEAALDPGSRKLRESRIKELFDEAVPQRRKHCEDQTGLGRLPFARRWECVHTSNRLDASPKRNQRPR